LSFGENALNKAIRGFAIVCAGGWKSGIGGRKNHDPRGGQNNGDITLRVMERHDSLSFVAGH